MAQGTLSFKSCNGIQIYPLQIGAICVNKCHYRSWNAEQFLYLSLNRPLQFGNMWIWCQLR